MNTRAERASRRLANEPDTSLTWYVTYLSWAREGEWLITMPSQICVSVPVCIRWGVLGEDEAAKPQSEWGSVKEGDLAHDSIARDPDRRLTH